MPASNKCTTRKRMSPCHLIITSLISVCCCREKKEQSHGIVFCHEFFFLHLNDSKEKMKLFFKTSSCGWTCALLLHVTMVTMMVSIALPCCDTCGFTSTLTIPRTKIKALSSLKCFILNFHKDSTTRFVSVK